MKSERLRWAVLVTGKRRRIGACCVLVGKPKERDHLEDLGVDWILKKLEETAIIGYIWLRIRPL
jgi:hypothetical protein